jgi:hypothetical protein
MFTDPVQKLLVMSELIPDKHNRDRRCSVVVITSFTMCCP